MLARSEVLMIGPYPAWDMEDLDARYVVYKLWEAADRDRLIDANRGAIRATATRGELGASANLMKRLPPLEIVSCYGVGTDPIDFAYAKANGIRVTNMPDVLTADVADMAIGLLLSVARKIPQADQFVHEGVWVNGNMPLVTRLSGKPVGVVGMGRVGAAVAKRLAAFDCDIAYYDVGRRADLPYLFVPDLVELARQVESLVVTLAGGEGTKGIINADVLDALGPTASSLTYRADRSSTKLLLFVRWRRRRSREPASTTGTNLTSRRGSKASITSCFSPTMPQAIETRRSMGKLVRDNLAAHFSGAALLTPVL